MRCLAAIFGVLLLAGCTTDEDPDAAVVVDAPIRPPDAPRADAFLVDAGPRIDGRIVDARPDGRIPDARPTPDAGVLTLRPLPPSRASLRLLDLRPLGTQAAVKICVFDEDADPRPYAVLARRSRPPGSSAVPATDHYVEVPAGMGLKVSIHLLGAGPLDEQPAGCDRGAAIDLRDGASLADGGFYTAAYSSTDDLLADCSSSQVDGCQFFPSHDTPPASMCAADGLRTFHDGPVGSGGFRVINLTNDAALISYSTGVGDLAEARHPDLPFSFAESYDDPANDSLLLVCPAYLVCLDGVDDVGAQTECTLGTTAWVVGQVVNARILSGTKFTTVYVVGDVRALNATETGLIGPDVDLVVANDIAD